MALEPNPAQPLLGTRYFPTGYKLRRAYEARGEVAMVKDILAPGALTNFIPWLLARPQIWPKIAWNIIGTTATADYRLQYLSGNLYLPGLSELQDFARSWLGAYGLAALALAALVGRSLWLPGLFLLTLPLAVWAGDGFYEFEKHFAPYWMLLPLVFSAAPSFRWRRRAEGSGNHDGASLNSDP